MMSAPFFVGPFGTLCPPNLFFKGFRVDFGAGQKELSTCSETEFLTFFIYASDAAQHHGAVGAPAVDVLFLVGEVVSLDNLVVVAQMLESGVGVHLREATIHDANAQALAIDALINEMLSAKTLHLVSKDVYWFVVIEHIAKFVLLRSIERCHGAIGDDFLNASHERQLCNQGGIIVSGLNAHGIEPTRLAKNLVGVGANRVDIAVIQRIVADVVQVGATLLITRDGLGIKIGIRIELGFIFVGEENPETLALCHNHAA